MFYFDINCAIIDVMRCWFSGRMSAFQAEDKGSIPLRRTKLLILLSIKHFT